MSFLSVRSDVDYKGTSKTNKNPGVVGLRNLGNTCFMNSGLQCLLSNPALVKYFLETYKKASPNERNHSLAESFADLVLRCWCGQYSEVRPVSFKACLGTHYSQFKDNRQHDCQEFLALLLDSLHEDLNSCPLYNNQQPPPNLTKPTTPSMSDVSSSRTVSTVRLIDAGDSKSDESGVYLPDSQSAYDCRHQHHSTTPCFHFHTSHSQTNFTTAISDARPADGVVENDDSNHSSGIVVRCKSPSCCDLKQQHTGFIRNDIKSSSSIEDFYMKDTKTLNTNVSGHQEPPLPLSTDSCKFLNNKRTTHNINNNTSTNNNNQTDNMSSELNEILLTMMPVSYNSSNNEEEDELQLKGGDLFDMGLKQSNLSSNCNIHCLSDKFEVEKELLFGGKNCWSGGEVVEGGGKGGGWSGGEVVEGGGKGDGMYADSKRMKIDLVHNYPHVPKILNLTQQLQHASPEMCKGHLDSHSPSSSSSSSSSPSSVAPSSSSSPSSPSSSSPLVTPQNEDEEEEEEDDDIGRQADRCWQEYLSRNRSVIVNNLQGQFRSIVVCSECQHLSATFEPFMYLSLPIPRAFNKQLVVHYVPWEAHDHTTTANNNILPTTAASSHNTSSTTDHTTTNHTTTDHTTTDHTTTDHTTTDHTTTDHTTTNHTTTNTTTTVTKFLITVNKCGTVQSIIDQLNNLLTTTTTATSNNDTNNSNKNETNKSTTYNTTNTTNNNPHGKVIVAEVANNRTYRILDEQMSIRLINDTTRLLYAFSLPPPPPLSSSPSSSSSSSSSSSPSPSSPQLIADTSSTNPVTTTFLPLLIPQIPPSPSSSSPTTASSSSSSPTPSSSSSSLLITTTSILTAHSSSSLPPKTSLSSSSPSSPTSPTSPLFFSPPLTTTSPPLPTTTSSSPPPTTTTSSPPPPTSPPTTSSSPPTTTSSPPTTTAATTSSSVPHSLAASNHDSCTITSHATAAVGNYDEGDDDDPSNNNINNNNNNNSTNTVTDIYYETVTQPTATAQNNNNNNHSNNKSDFANNSTTTTTTTTTTINNTTTSNTTATATTNSTTNNNNNNNSTSTTSNNNNDNTDNHNTENNNNKNDFKLRNKKLNNNTNNITNRNTNHNVNNNNNNNSTTNNNNTNSNNTNNTNTSNNDNSANENSSKQASTTSFCTSPIMSFEGLSPIYPANGGGGDGDGGDGGGDGGGGGGGDFDYEIDAGGDNETGGGGGSNDVFGDDNDYVDFEVGDAGALLGGKDVCVGCGESVDGGGCVCGGYEGVVSGGYEGEVVSGDGEGDGFAGAAFKGELNDDDAFKIITVDTNNKIQQHHDNNNIINSCSSNNTNNNMTTSDSLNNKRDKHTATTTIHLPTNPNIVWMHNSFDSDNSNYHNYTDDDNNYNDDDNNNNYTDNDPQVGKRCLFNKDRYKQTVDWLNNNSMSVDAFQADFPTPLIDSPYDTMDHFRGTAETGHSVFDVSALSNIVDNALNSHNNNPTTTNDTNHFNVTSNGMPTHADLLHNVQVDHPHNIQVDLPHPDCSAWKCCAICLEEMEDSCLKVHPPCGGTLCGECLELSFRLSALAFKCPVCRFDVSGSEDFLKLEQLDTYKHKPMTLTMSVSFRMRHTDTNTGTTTFHPFSHPRLLHLSSQTTTHHLYHTIHKLLPLKHHAFVIHLVDSQGVRCSRCPYFKHCTGCEVNKLYSTQQQQIIQQQQQQIIQQQQHPQQQYDSPQYLNNNATTPTLDTTPLTHPTTPLTVEASQTEEFATQQQQQQQQTPDNHQQHSLQNDQQNSLPPQQPTNQPTTTLNFTPNDHLMVTYTHLPPSFLHHDDSTTTTNHPSMLQATNNHPITLLECFQAFSKSEILDANNPWYCPRCRKNQCAQQSISVEKFPKTLIIHLKRFVYQDLSVTKIDAEVDFPLTDLTLQPHLTHPHLVYDLQSCICHSGGVDAGHYIAYSKHLKTKEWHCFNDMTFSLKQPSQSDFSRAYVLFYQLQGTSEADFDIPEDIQLPADDLRPQESNLFNGLDLSFHTTPKARYSEVGRPSLVRHNSLENINLNDTLKFMDLM